MSEHEMSNYEIKRLEMLNSLAGDTAKKKIYIEENFGKKLADDLHSAALSGKMPEVLDEFVRGKLTVQVQKKNDGISSVKNNSNIQHLDYVTMFSGNEYEDGTWSHDTGRDMVKRAFKDAASVGNIEFIKSFIEDNKTKNMHNAFACLIKNYRGEPTDDYLITATAIRNAIDTDKFEVIDTIVKNDKLCGLVTELAEEDQNNRGGNFLLGVMGAYIVDRSQAIAHLLEHKKISDFVQGAISEGRVKQQLVDDLQKLQQSRSPVIEQQITGQKVTK